MRDRIRLVCPGDHALAARARVSWAQALQHPFVSLTPDFTNRLQADLFKHSDALALHPAHEVSFITTALGMVRGGFGITAQPSRVLPMLESFGLVSRPLTSPTVDRHLSLFCARAAHCRRRPRASGTSWSASCPIHRPNCAPARDESRAQRSR